MNVSSRQLLLRERGKRTLEGEGEPDTRSIDEEVEEKEKRKEEEAEEEERRRRRRGGGRRRRGWRRRYNNIAGDSFSFLSFLLGFRWTQLSELGKLEKRGGKYIIYKGRRRRRRREDSNAPEQPHAA